VEHIKRLSAGDVITAEELRAGFFVDGLRIPLINPQRGIFKPTSMKHLLSVRTVYPRTGARVWYDDQRTVHGQIERGDELVDYAFMGRDADAADNRWLRDAQDNQIPILYFLGVAPQRYTLVWPTYVAEWLATELKVRLAFGAPATASREWSIPDVPERRYGLRLVRQRLHQAMFREAILNAYGNRCAMTGLPESHRTPRGGSSKGGGHFGRPAANLIGIDPDYQIHVSEALLSMNDGPMFEYGLKAMAGRLIKLPGRVQDYPDRNRLAERFLQFRP
jgi:putative restriction endonuclease